MKRNLIIICVLCIPQLLFAQYHPRYLRDAEKAFHQKQYFEAAHFYEKYLSIRKGKKIKNAPFIYYQLAEAHRGYENYAAAKKWYKAVTQTAPAQYPLAQLWYGVCARATLEPDTAEAYLQKFIDTYKGEEKYILMAGLELQNCGFAKAEYLKTVDKKIAEHKFNGNLNGAYALTKTKTGYIFTSAVLSPGGRYLNRLFLTNGNTVTPLNLNRNDIAEAEYGTAAFTADGKRLYFTRWYHQNGITAHEIYRSDWRNNTWATPVRLNHHINIKGYAAIQPFITGDGKRLYFVSDRPGGFGGQDIWVSDINIDGDAINSANLGSVINTAYDEQAPFYNSVDKLLIYSSKGRVGMGGFDFYESRNEAGVWSVPVNMGYPVNSVKDDIYYYPNDTQEGSFYISSDRESDCCLKIYEVNPVGQVIAGSIIDCQTRLPLAGVTVSVVNAGTKKMIKSLVTTAGPYSIRLTGIAPVELKLEKKGYITQNVVMANAGSLRTDTLYNQITCLQGYMPGKPVVLKNILFDFDKAILRPQSALVLDSLAAMLNSNPNMHIKIAAHTDSKGSSDYNARLAANRARACVDYLVTQGINAQRLTWEGYGEALPVAPNEQYGGKDNPAGRQLNRRIEFTIVKE